MTSAKVLWGLSNCAGGRVRDQKAERRK